MKILFNPKPHEKGGGTTSFISFDQPEFKEAIESIIRMRESETIESVEIEEEGIAVRLIKNEKADLTDPAFDEWWNDDALTWANPFAEETPIWWAWEGWAACKAYRAQRR
jgi:hypothetical protein